jgi:hypothetical protein
MKVVRIEVEMGRTVTLAKEYNTFRARIAMTAELEDGEDPNAAYEALADDVYHKLQVRVAQILPF